MIQKIVYLLFVSLWSVALSWGGSGGVADSTAKLRILPTNDDGIWAEGLWLP